jgi:hypothetical protein
MKSSVSALSRRRFLLASEAGCVAMAAAVANRKNPTTQPKKAEPAQNGRGYQVTEHVRKYYDTAKI